MTPQELAKLHSLAFVHERGWTADEFSDLLDTPFTRLIEAEHGFALTRTVADETEMLTLAVDPAQQRRGIGRQLCNLWLTGLPPAITTAFLEVAADNHPAIALYASIGFEPVGQRKAYYARENAAPVDARIMQLRLTHGQHPESRT